MILRFGAFDVIKRYDGRFTGLHFLLTFHALVVVLYFLVDSSLTTCGFYLDPDSMSYQVVYSSVSRSRAARLFLFALFCIATCPHWAISFDDSPRREQAGRVPSPTPVS